MAELRGEYRAIHVTLVDSPEFQALGPDERLMVCMLKLRLGVTGIDVIRVLAAELQYLTGLNAKRAAKAFAVLRENNWIRVEGPVVWLRNSLKFEPSRSMRNENHRTEVKNYLRGLPRLQIVNEFAGYYGLEIPFPDLPGVEKSSNQPITEAMTHGLGDGIPHALPDHGERRTEERKNGRTENGERMDGAAVAASTPLVGGDPFARFVEIYPKRAGADPAPAAQSAWNARLEDHIDPESLIQGAQRYRRYSDAIGNTGTQYVMQMATFLGPKKRGWEEAWAIPTNGRKPRGRQTPQDYDYGEGSKELPQWPK
jgi:hypothetical protein